MLARIHSAALHGIDAMRVDVEVDVGAGLPTYQVVGLPAASVKEGATRIRAALKNCGQDLPARHITVNLAPADRRKFGAFDLPIAVGVAIADGAAFPSVMDELLLVGELGLDGTLRPIPGVLAAAALARELRLRGVLVPRANAAEAAVVSGLEVYAAEHLAEVLRALDGAGELPRWHGQPSSAPASIEAGIDFAEVRGQQMAREAVEIAVAGGHNLLLYGTPGIGKTMIARRVPTILPPMTRDEEIEVTRIYSAVGQAPRHGLITRRPFRAPHHSISPAALVGGGPLPHPGEISLAHRGVLFLDELPEFSRTAIEALRQPLEDRIVHVSRIHGNMRFPAAFHLVASANPCPCGWHGSTSRTCTCSLANLIRYRSRLSGPILDRIDLQVRVNDVSLEDMRREESSETSAAIRARVESARDRQAARLARYRCRLNAEMSVAAARATCRLSRDAERVLGALFTSRGGFTARGIDRLIRVARTIADLRNQDVIDADAIKDAATFRALDSDPVVDPRFSHVWPTPATPHDPPNPGPADPHLAAPPSITGTLPVT